MASMKDVAQRAGVGVGTVSRVINDSGYVSADTRKKIERAIEELGYTPNELARNLFRNRTGIIGVLIPDLDHPFFSAFARETELSLYKLGYKTMICNTVGSSNRERDYLNMLDRNMVDGIITGAHTLHKTEYANRKHTIVALDQDFGPEIPIIGSDHLYGGKLAAEIMIKNGCKRIIQITGIAPNVAANDRHTVFEAAAIDGCSPIRTFFQIVMPISKTVYATVFILDFVAHWNDFMWPFLVMTGEDKRTIQLAVQSFFGTQPVHYSAIMAALVVSAIPMIIMFIFMQKYYVEGIASSGIKG